MLNWTRKKLSENKNLQRSRSHFWLKYLWFGHSLWKSVPNLVLLRRMANRRHTPVIQPYFIYPKNYKLTNITLYFQPNFTSNIFDEFFFRKQIFFFHTDTTKTKWLHTGLLSHAVAKIFFHSFCHQITLLTEILLWISTANNWRNTLSKKYHLKIE